MGQSEADHFSGFASNHFIQRRQINQVVGPLADKMYGLPTWKLEAYEEDAIAAAAALAFAQGDLARLAEEISAGRQFTDDELKVLSTAATTLRRHPDFTNQLFNGDATPLINDALSQAKSRWGFEDPEPVDPDSVFAPKTSRPKSSW